MSLNSQKWGFCGTYNGKVQASLLWHVRWTLTQKFVQGCASD